MWEKIAVELGQKLVEKFLNREKRGDEDLVSIGLAVGYFYNFLDPISREIQRDSLTVFDNSKGDGEGLCFEADDVKVDIIIPNRLDVRVFDTCVKEFKKTHKGFIYLAENKRYYGINYALTDLGVGQAITIIDLARPIMSVKRFYETILKMSTGKDADAEWLKIQVAEISAFKETLRELQLEGYGALVDKLDFRERG